MVTIRLEMKGLSQDIEAAVAVGKSGHEWARIVSQRVQERPVAYKDEDLMERLGVSHDVPMEARNMTY